MEPIAKVAFDLPYTSDKTGVRLYAPEPVTDSSDWACIFESDESPLLTPFMRNPATAAPLSNGRIDGGLIDFIKDGRRGLRSARRTAWPFEAAETGSISPGWPCRWQESSQVGLFPLPTPQLVR
jgi:hypothetical protein